MQRYFINETDISKDKIIINKDDSHHIKNVMRMKEGTLIKCLINNKKTYLAKITSLNKLVEAQIINEVDENNELMTKVTIAHGLSTNKKVEETIKRLVELGVFSYIPVNMKKSKYTLENIKDERLNKIIKEASEQSHRTKLLELKAIINFKDLETLANNYDELYFLDLESNIKIQTALAKIRPQSILVVIGPDAGFAPEERLELQKWGYIGINAGSRVLRTETAAIYMASVANFLYGDNNAN